MKYSIYIPSKNRSLYCLTANLLRQDEVDFKIVVEPQDAKTYKERYGEKVLVMDKNDAGIAYARNWIKRYSISEGEKYHWQIDDNIRNFKKRYDGKNHKHHTLDCLPEVEDYVSQHDNIAISGLKHSNFAFSAKNCKDFNKQIYSCFLVKNDVPINWREDVVEDTDYSLQVLTKGYCTVIFNRLVMDKMATGKMKGGNTEISYGEVGRVKRSVGLQKAWPDAFKLSDCGTRVKPSRIWSTFKQQPILL